ncbi:MAG: adenosylcobinamide-GDP ribazoletransferase [Mogibacterium sp.]|nr:adenosylcobinamide-GDP ribazoletransferase [Mogibacterium sp.]
MKLLKAIAVAFAQYSRIPVPRFEWKEEDMRYSIAAFPLVGAVIGLVFFGVYRCTAHFALPDAAAALLLTAVPLIITGGFHVDGFMDVSDALSSFKSREEKLAILKDPHIGAFAVIRLAVCGLIYVASLITVLASDESSSLILGVASGFVLSRCLSALSVLSFRSAKKEGMLYYEATSAAGGRNANLIIVSVIGAASVWAMVYFTWPAEYLMLIAGALSFAWYKHVSYKQFGGITGDTAGYFVVICETAIAAAAALTTVTMPM